MKLSEEELTALSSELARATIEHSDLEREKSERLKVLAAQLRAKRVQISHLISVLTAKAELRDVECYELIDYTKNAVIIRRADTGETVGRRAITDDDRQTSLEA